MSVRVQGHVTLPISCLNDATPYIALLCILSAACLLLAVQVTKAGPVSLGMNGIQFCITYNGKLSLGMRLLAHQGNTISMQALEYSQKHERIPSCILAVGEGSAAGTGGLYHGGFKAIMNAEFLRKERVTHIVNTAKGLEIFGPKYLVGFSLFCNVHSK